MKLDIFARHHHSQTHRLAVVMLAAMAWGFTGTLANAQSDDLVTAAGRGDLPAVNALLKAGADVNAGSRPALYVAAMVGNLDVVRALLAAKPDLDWRDPMVGTTALMQAIAPWRDNFPGRLPFPRGRWDIAQLLVEAGANVNVMSKTGVTALMLVAEESSPRSLAMVQALLAAHADINGGCTTGVRQGLTALSNSPPPTLESLQAISRQLPLSPISDGGNYSRGGYTALGLAASTGSVEVVQALLDANVQRSANPSSAVNATQPGGNTPLTLASAKGRSDVVRLLLAAKADVSVADSNGKTALMLALENNHAEVAELLRSAAAAAPGQR